MNAVDTQTQDPIEFKLAFSFIIFSILQIFLCALPLLFPIRCHISRYRCVCWQSTKARPTDARHRHQTIRLERKNDKMKSRSDIIGNLSIIRRYDATFRIHSFLSVSRIIREHSQFRYAIIFSSFICVRRVRFFSCRGFLLCSLASFATSLLYTSPDFVFLCLLSCLWCIGEMLDRHAGSFVNCIYIFSQRDTWCNVNPTLTVTTSEGCVTTFIGLFSFLLYFFPLLLLSGETKNTNKFGAGEKQNIGICDVTFNIGYIALNFLSSSSYFSSQRRESKQQQIRENTSKGRHCRLNCVFLASILCQYFFFYSRHVCRQQQPSNQQRRGAGNKKTRYNSLSQALNECLLPWGTNQLEEILPRKNKTNKDNLLQSKSFTRTDRK